MSKPHSNFSCLIYCGGKCGSMTLLNTLNKSGEYCLHFHSDGDFIQRYPHVVEKTNCRDVLSFIKYQTEKNVYIIDSYRDPIERKISSFFNNIHVHIGYFYQNVHVDILIYFFNRLVQRDIENYHPLDGILPNFQFDFTKKYFLKKEGNLTYVKLRFKDISSWGEILSEIFQKEIKIESSNVSENKEYFALYQKFRKRYKVPFQELKKMMEDEIFKRYNTEIEQEEYFNKWKLKSEEVNEDLKRLENVQLKNVPENFVCSTYRLKYPAISAEYKSDVELKVFYEIFGNIYPY